MGLIDKLRAIGNAIRARTGKTAELTLDEMAEEIEALEGDSIPPHYINSSQITSLIAFCKNGVNLSVIGDPNFDTTNVEDYTECFFGCYAADVLPLSVNTDHAKKTHYMYASLRCDTFADLSFSEMHLPCVTDASYMFNNIRASYLPVLKNYSTVQNFQRMFTQCSFLKEMHLPETNSGTNFQEMFMYCDQIESISLNMANATNYRSTFQRCSALTELSIGSLKIKDDQFALKDSINLSVESLVGVLEALQDNSGEETTYTVYLGSTNLAKLTDEQKAIAARKNINLA